MVILTHEEHTFDNIQHSFIRKSLSKVQISGSTFYLINGINKMQHLRPYLMVTTECFLTKTERKARIISLST